MSRSSRAVGAAAPPGGPTPVQPVAAIPLGPRRDRLLAAICAAGACEVAEFRGWERLIRWRRLPTGRARLGALLTLAKLPLRAPRDAYGHVRALGRDIEAQAGVSRARQFLQLWWLGLRHGLDVHAYLDYQLCRPERWRRAPAYLAEMEFVRAARFLVGAGWRDESRMLWDRRRFEALCRDHDLPAASTILEIAEGVVTFAAAGEHELPPYDLFSKPNPSSQGEGAERWLHDGAGRWTGHDGRARTADELLAELAARSRRPGGRAGRPRAVLVKRCLRNHSELADLTPGGLCTIRLQTYRMPGEAPSLLFGTYRMPTGDSPADNFHLGGLAAPVDPATGRLGAAIVRRGRLIEQVERHPDTGARVVGRTLPHWADAVALVLRAHALLPKAAFVGWDVAIVPEGAVLIEGNTVPGPDVAQGPSGVPLGETAFVRCLNRHLRAAFAI